MKKKKIYICPKCEEINTEICILTGLSFNQGGPGRIKEEGDYLARPDLPFGEEDLESDY